MKATTRPHCTGRLVNHQLANSVVMTSTVAPCHPMPWSGHKTVTTTTSGRALHQDKTAFLPAKLASFSPSGSRPHGQKNLSLYMWPDPDSIWEQPGHPSEKDEIHLLQHSLTSFTFLACPIVKTSEHSTEEHTLDLSLRLNIGLRLLCLWILPSSS
jgi:hypothetical protein